MIAELVLQFVLAAGIDAGRRHVLHGDALRAWVYRLVRGKGWPRH